MTAFAGHYVATKAAELRRLKEKAYSNPAKLGGQPVYANITEMEAVSNHRLALMLPPCVPY
jgi:hypothetical protein